MKGCMIFERTLLSRKKSHTTLHDHVLIVTFFTVIWSETFLGCPVYLSYKSWRAFSGNVEFVGTGGTMRATIFLLSSIVIILFSLSNALEKLER